MNSDRYQFIDIRGTRQEGAYCFDWALGVITHNTIATYRDSRTTIQFLNSEEWKAFGPQDALKLNSCFTYPEFQFGNIALGVDVKIDEEYRNILFELTEEIGHTGIDFHKLERNRGGIILIINRVTSTIAQFANHFVSMGFNFEEKRFFYYDPLLSENLVQGRQIIEFAQAFCDVMRVYGVDVDLPPVRTRVIYPVYILGFEDQINPPTFREIIILAPQPQSRDIIERVESPAFSKQREVKPSDLKRQNLFPKGEQLIVPKSVLIDKLELSDILISYSNESDLNEQYYYELNNRHNCFLMGFMDTELEKLKDNLTDSTYYEATFLNIVKFICEKISRSIIDFTEYLDQNCERSWAHLTPDACIVGEYSFKVLEFSVVSNERDLESRLSMKQIKYGDIINKMNLFLKNDSVTYNVIILNASTGIIYINGRKNGNIETTELSNSNRRIKRIINKASSSGVRLNPPRVDELTQLPYTDLLSEEQIANLKRVELDLNLTNDFIPSDDLENELISYISNNYTNLDFYPKLQTSQEIRNVTNKLIRTSNNSDLERGYRVTNYKIKPSLHFMLDCNNQYECNTEYYCDILNKLSGKESEYGYTEAKFINRLSRCVFSATNTGQDDKGKLIFVREILKAIGELDDNELSHFFLSSADQSRKLKDLPKDSNYSPYRKSILIQRSDYIKSISYYQRAGVSMSKIRREEDNTDIYYCIPLNDEFVLDYERTVEFFLEDDTDRIEVNEVFKFISDYCSQSLKAKLLENRTRILDLVNCLRSTKMYRYLWSVREKTRQLIYEGSKTANKNLFSIGTGGYRNYFFIMAGGNRNSSKSGSRPFMQGYVVKNSHLRTLNRNIYIKYHTYILDDDHSLILTNWSRFDPHKMIQKYDAFTRVLATMFNSYMLADQDHELTKQLFVTRGLFAVNSASKLIEILKLYQNVLIGTLSDYSRVGELLEKKANVRPRSCAEVYALRRLFTSSIRLSRSKEDIISKKVQVGELDDESYLPYNEMGGKFDCPCIWNSHLKYTEFEQFVEDMYIVHVGYRETTTFVHSIINTLNTVISTNTKYKKLLAEDSILLKSLPGDDLMSNMTQIRELISNKTTHGFNAYFTRLGAVLFRKRYIDPCKAEIKREIINRSEESEHLSVFATTKASTPEVRSTKHREKVHDEILKVLTDPYYSTGCNLYQYLKDKLGSKTDVDSLEHIYEVSLRVQFGPDREIYIPTLFSKLLCRVAERTYNIIAEYCPVEFISKGGLRKEKIMEDQNLQIRSILASDPNPQDPLRQYLLKYYNMDRMKWSIQQIITAYLCMHREFKELFGEQLYYLIFWILYSMKNKKIRMNLDLKEILEKMSFYNDLVSEMKRANLSEDFLHILTGWCQGILNNISSIAHCCTTELGDWIVRLIIKKKELNSIYIRFSCRHSDDANDVVITQSEELHKIVIMSDRIACILYGIKDSPTKSNYMRKIREFISVYYENMKSVLATIKYTSVFGSNMSCTGLAADMNESIGKIQNLIDKGLSECQGDYIMRIVYLIIESTYRTGPGMINDITKLLNRDRDSIPFEIGGRPVIDMCLLPFAGPMSNNMRIFNHVSDGPILINHICKIIPSLSSDNEIADELSNEVFMSLPSIQYNMIMRTRIAHKRRQYPLTEEIKKILETDYLNLIRPRSGRLATLSLQASYYKRSFAQAYGSSNQVANFCRLASSVRGKCINCRGSKATFLEVISEIWETYHYAQDNNLSYLNIDCWYLVSRCSPAAEALMKYQDTRELLQPIKSDRVFLIQAIPNEEYQLKLHNPIDVMCVYIKYQDEGLSNLGRKLTRPYFKEEDIEMIKNYLNPFTIENLDFESLLKILQRASSKRKYVRAAQFSGSLQQYFLSLLNYQYLDHHKVSSRFKGNIELRNPFSHRPLLLGKSPEFRAVVDYFICLYNAYVYILYKKDEEGKDKFDSKESKLNAERSLRAEMKTEEFKLYSECLLDTLNLEDKLRSLLKGTKLYSLVGFLSYIGILDKEGDRILVDSRRIHKRYITPQKRVRGVWTGAGSVELRASAYRLNYYIQADGNRKLDLFVPKGVHSVNMTTINKLIVTGYAALETQAHTRINFCSYKNIFSHNNLPDPYQTEEGEVLRLDFTTGLITGPTSNCYSCLIVHHEIQTYSEFYKSKKLEVSIDYEDKHGFFRMNIKDYSPITLTLMPHRFTKKIRLQNFFWMDLDLSYISSYNDFKPRPQCGRIWGHSHSLSPLDSDELQRYIYRRAQKADIDHLRTKCKEKIEGFRKKAQSVPRSKTASESLKLGSVTTGSVISDWDQMLDDMDFSDIEIDIPKTSEDEEDLDWETMVVESDSAIDRQSRRIRGTRDKNLLTEIYYRFWVNDTVTRDHRLEDFAQAINILSIIENDDIYTTIPDNFFKDHQELILALDYLVDQLSRFTRIKITSFQLTRVINKVFTGDRRSKLSKEIEELMESADRDANREHIIGDDDSDQDSFDEYGDRDDDEYY